MSQDGPFQPAPEFLAKFERLTSRLGREVSRLTELTPPRDAAIELGLLRGAIDDIAETIARSKAELADIAPPAKQSSHLIEASGELDAIMGATERAASQIMAAMERSQAASARLRARFGRDAATIAEFDRIDQAASEIYTACSFQDLVGQRVRRVANALNWVETRIKTLVGLWQPMRPTPVRAADDLRPDAALMHGPSDDGLGQADVDRLFDVSADPRR